jgi:hypothetical protein
LVRVVVLTDLFLRSWDEELMRYGRTMLEEQKMWDEWYPS